MIELAYGSPFKHEVTTTHSWNLERLELTRILHNARVEHDNGTALELEKIFIQTGGFFNADDDVLEEDSLQAALTA